MVLYEQNVNVVSRKMAKATCAPKHNEEKPDLLSRLDDLFNAFWTKLALREQQAKTHRPEEHSPMVASTLHSQMRTPSNREGPNMAPKTGMQTHMPKPAHNHGELQLTLLQEACHIQICLSQRACFTAHPGFRDHSDRPYKPQKACLFSTIYLQVSLQDGY
ncbi:Hypothetical predicted protein [Pelobates cultripes]|uniref:Uncharacterized protein n=1 Tax=Pelobates cultripes TaxID=61616 RepID=A0AAD1WMB2_PELCU|nr:Hypothetical predicted protein [Pelobates cultripes]